VLGDALRAAATGLLYAVLPTVSVAELIWMLAGSVALWANFRGWRWRYRIMHRALRMQDKLEQRSTIIAQQRHEAEAFGLGIQVALWLLGIVAALSPEMPPREITAEQAAIVLFYDLVLLGMQVALAVGSVRQRRYDRTLRALPSVRSFERATETG
jgi:hypothetical protein